MVAANEVATRSQMAIFGPSDEELGSLDGDLAPRVPTVGDYQFYFHILCQFSEVASGGRTTLVKRSSRDCRIAYHPNEWESHKTEGSLACPSGVFSRLSSNYPIDSRTS